MEHGDIINNLLRQETYEVSDLTCEADVSKSLAGKSWQFSALDHDANEVTYQPYYIAGGDGEDPTLGTKEVDAITNRADSSADLRSTYFTINDGNSASETAYYCYFTVDGTGYDPKLGQYEITDITLRADSSGDLDGKYWILADGGDNAFYVWYAVAGETNTDPAPGGTGIVVYIANGATELQVLAETKDAINAQQTDVFTATVKSTAYQEYGLTGKSGATDTGLAQETVYYFKLNQDGLGVLEYSVTTPAETVTFTILMALINAAVTGATWTIVGGDLRCTRDDTPFGASIALSAGTTGTDLAATLTDFTAYDTAVQANELTVTNDDTGHPTEAADGDIGGAFAVSVTQSGVDAVAGLAAKTLLTLINVATDATDTAVCTAMTAAFNALSGWSATARAGAEDHITDVTHATKGNCTNSADGNVGGVFAIAVTAGSDPTTDTSISVVIAEDATGAAVATATKAAIEAAIPMLMHVAISTADLTLTSRRLGVTTDIADVDTGWAAIAKTTDGLDTVTEDGGINTGELRYKPDLDKTWRIQKAVVIITDADCSDASKFGGLTALSTGCDFKVVDKDGTDRINFAAKIKTNDQLFTLGAGYVQQGTIDTLQVEIDFIEMLGRPLIIDGGVGDYIVFLIADDLSDLDTLYVRVQGYEVDTLSRAS